MELVARQRFPRVNNAIWNDPYNPKEFWFTEEKDLKVYNIYTNEIKKINSFDLNISSLKRSWLSRDIIVQIDNRFINLGVDAKELQKYDNLKSLIQNRYFYCHKTTVNYMELSFNGIIFFRCNSNEIWSINQNGSNPKKLFTLDNQTGGTIITDPYNKDNIVYVDGNDIICSSISTNIKKTIIKGFMGDNKGMFLLNGILYTNYTFDFEPDHGFIVVKLDDRSILKSWKPPIGFIWGFGFLVDTVDKKCFHLEDDKYYLNYISVDDLPEDPYNPEQGSFRVLNRKKIKSDLVNMFKTGDSLDFKAHGKDIKSKFCKIGDKIELKDNVAIPFDKPGQSISLQLEHEELKVDYEDEGILVHGKKYSNGESLVIGGKKVTVMDI